MDQDTKKDPEEGDHARDGIETLQGQHFSLS